MLLEIDYQPFFDFVNERHAIYLRKTILEGKKPDPRYDPLKAEVDSKWSLDHLTDDPVLAHYRFCNVFRELDRVTIWIREAIRERWADHEHLWFMLAASRMLNWPATLSDLILEGAWPDNPDFTPALMTASLDARKARGEKVYTGAYMIRAESDSRQIWYSWTKQRYTAEIVLGRLWEHRDYFRREFEDPKMTVQNAWQTVMKHHDLIGWGPFMTFQWMLELRHTRYLCNAHDASSWAAIGPGSSRGLNRLHGRPLDEKVWQLQAQSEMMALRELYNSHRPKHVPELEMEDVQNSLCETDKLLRARNGEGRPRAHYIRGRGY